MIKVGVKEINIQYQYLFLLSAAQYWINIYKDRISM